MFERDTSACWRVTESAENDATAVSFGEAKSTAVNRTAGPSVIDEVHAADSPRWGQQPGGGRSSKRIWLPGA